MCKHALTLCYKHVCLYYFIPCGAKFLAEEYAKERETCHKFLETILSCNIILISNSQVERLFLLLALLSLLFLDVPNDINKMIGCSLFAATNSIDCKSSFDHLLHLHVVYYMDKESYKWQVLLTSLPGKALLARVLLLFCYICMQCYMDKESYKCKRYMTNVYTYLHAWTKKYIVTLININRSNMGKQVSDAS